MTVPRGIPTTLEYAGARPCADAGWPPADAPGAGSGRDHSSTRRRTRVATDRELDLIARFQQTPAFFSSPALCIFACTGRHPPELPRGRTASERRGRVFFEDLPPGLQRQSAELQTRRVRRLPQRPDVERDQRIPAGRGAKGTRFQSRPGVRVQRRRQPGHHLRLQEPAARPGPDHQSGSDTRTASSKSPARIPDARSSPAAPTTSFHSRPGSFDHLNAFKISPLWGVKDTAPYFHDNSAKTLEDVAEHYRQFFLDRLAIPTDRARRVR